MFEALIQKLEAAIEWDEQLDREIEEAIDGDGRRLGWGPYPYTSKIDAARGLLDRVLPGWSYRVARCAVSDDAWVIPDFNCPVHGERLRAALRQDIDWSDLTDVDLRPSGREATALCISILKALEIINAKSHQASEAAPAETGAEARPDSEATAQTEGGANRERAQQETEANVVDLRAMLQTCDPADVARVALDAERHIIAQEARRYAGHYPEASDGRNTFIIFAEYVESREKVPLDVFTIGENTMSRVFKPSGLTNLHDLQAVLDAVEKSLTPGEPVAEVLDRAGGFLFSIFPEAFHRLHIGDKLYRQPSQASLSDEVKKLRNALTLVRAEFITEYDDEKLCGIGHASDALPRVIEIIDDALTSTGGARHAE